MGFQQHWAAQGEERKKCSLHLMEKMEGSILKNFKSIHRQYGLHLPRPQKKHSYHKNPSFSSQLHQWKSQIVLRMRSMPASSSVSLGSGQRYPQI